MKESTTDLGRSVRQLTLQKRVLEAKALALTKEVRYLRAELYSQQRIRVLLSKLLRATDKALSLQIMKLDKKGSTYTVQRASVKTPRDSNVEEYGGILRMYDFDHYYSQKARTTRKKRIAYSVVSTIYKQQKRLVRKSIKIVIRAGKK